MGSSQVTGQAPVRVGFGGVRHVFTRRACLRSDLKQRKEPTVRGSGGGAFQVARPMHRLCSRSRLADGGAGRTGVGRAESVGVWVSSLGSSHRGEMYI